MAEQLTRIHCSYHKCMTGYYAKVMGALYNKLMPWSRGYRHFNSDLSKFYDNFSNYKLSSINNHILDLSRLGDYRVTRFIRDPRDMVVSGYFYHKRGAEDWCKHIAPNIDRSIIDNEILLTAMGNEHSFSSYLQSLDEEEGLIAEIEFRRRHFETILQWPRDDPRIKLFRYEDIIGNESKVFREVLEFYELSNLESALGAYLARRYSASRQSGKIKHIRNHEANQWKKYFTRKVSVYFNERYTGLLKSLDYEIQ